MGKLKPLAWATQMIMGTNLLLIQHLHAQEDVQRLPVIQVQAEQEPSYVAKQITLAKSNTSLKDTPQSVSVVTRQRLDDQNINTLEDAMKNVTGVTVQRFDSAGTYSIFNARGYGSDTYQMDGTTLRTDSNGSYIDLAVYDQIEVLRGAAGLFSGAGEPGVTFNMVRKKALATPSLETKVSVGSWNNYRTDLDVTGALSEDGKVRGRFVTALQSFDTYINGLDDNSKALAYGTMEFDITDTATVSLGATYQYIDTVLSRGIPTWANGKLLNVSRSTSFIQDWNNQQLESKSFFGEFKQALNHDGEVKATVRYVTRKNDAQYSDPVVPNANGDMINFNALAFKREDKDLSADLYLSTPFSLFGQTHNFLIGADYLKGQGETDYTSYRNTLSGVVNVYHDNQYAFGKPDFIYGINVSKSELENYGIYSQLRLKLLDDVSLITGGRISWWDNTSTALVSDGVIKNTQTNYKESAELTPYASLLWDITPQISAYTSYSQIFKPQNSYRFDSNNPNGVGIQLDPRTGSQIELGMKAGLFNDQLNLSTAIFQIDDKNRAMDDPLNDRYSIASGKVRSRGFEVDAVGKLSQDWDLSAGYAYNDNKYLKDNKNEGKTFSTFTPRHSFNLWTHYKLPDTLISGLDIGTGLRYVSKFYSQSGQVRIESDGYTVVDASIGYKINPNIKASLNVYNLFDESYWEKVSGTSRQNFFGAPRNFMLTLRAKY
ncbi:hypothetical protein F991_02052 [Acinetobacter sp. CIP-A165]|uniref:TonB-dependent siderophore receptor n=1 Tax=Acinetobacter sp. CIP-A165 TaxID=40373 RepID=UPI0002CE5691|nr:TonB-dependent siderophore receptor [Acinetobacter sp. CIP-A165]ENU30253.1 hypothetical protein F991_02052 [Acinetobacter sp. CIP-A165]